VDHEARSDAPRRPGKLFCALLNQWKKFTQSHLFWRRINKTPPLEMSFSSLPLDNAAHCTIVVGGTIGSECLWIFSNALRLNIYGAILANEPCLMIEIRG
jgi:hypothetical protein